jgi:TolB protein
MPSYFAWDKYKYEWGGSRMAKRVLGRFAVGLLLLTVFSVFRVAPAQEPASTVGIFEGDGDVGTVRHAGKGEYDSSKHSYTLTGSGENMWSNSDNFQFAWKKWSADASLTADVSFVGQGGNAHRKAVLMMRQSLDPDSAYVDVALHGDGLTSLQYRETKGATTHEIQSNISAPTRLRIEKRGDYVFVSLGTHGEKLQPSGAAMRVSFSAPFYVGIGVCSHDKDAIEKAVFSNVEMKDVARAGTADQTTLYSTLEVITVTSTDRRVVYSIPGHFEAPNWTRDGSAFIFNAEGRIQRLPVAGGRPQTIDTGFAVRCNNDHGISPDGKTLAISDQSQGDHQSIIYLLPLTGGIPRRITQKSPSYWHGWSPDGKTLAYPGQRNGEFDIYTISTEGGEEKQLTTAIGLDDGPEYTPDGKYIYFNSVRTGRMQIWRMRPDGSEQEKVTSDDLNNWFPHISPDGKWLVFLSYGEEVEGHPENKDVMLRIVPLKDDNVGGKIEVLAKLFGGQGTINVPSWSPDSNQLAFVSYQLIPRENAVK